MSHLNLMWYLMMNFSQFCSWSKAQYYQIGQILYNEAHRAVNRRILNSRILGSIQILRKISAKPQLMSRALLHKILIKFWRHHSPNHKHRKIQPDREHLYLKWMNVQLQREFKKHQVYGKFLFLNNHPTHPGVYHLKREKRDKNSLKIRYGINWS